MAKPFLSYEQLLDKLENEKNLIIHNREYAKHMLEHISYYALISGYKNPYRNKTTQKFKDGTTFEEIVALYKFDENLRELFLKYLLQVERHVRSTISYSFSEQYGEGQIAYLSETNYNYISKHKKGINKLVKKLEDEIKFTTSPYIQYQRDTYSNVPLWVRF